METPSLEIRKLDPWMEERMLDPRLQSLIREPWTCNICSEWNQLEIKNIKYKLQICHNCGIAFPTLRVMAYLGLLDQFPIHEEYHKDRIWNGMCLPVRKLANDIPIGKDGEKWIDRQNGKFSRSDYIKAHGLDPEIFCEYKKKSKRNSWE